MAMKTVDDLRADYAVAEENAREFLEQRCDADRERHIAHLHYIRWCKEMDVLRAQINRALAEET